MAKYIHPQEIFHIIKKHGWDGASSVGNYWFEHADSLWPLIDRKYPNHAQMASLQMRWLTSIGMVCKDQIVFFISKSLNDAAIVRQENFNKYQETGDFRYILNRPEISFEDFRFNFENNIYSLNDFLRMFNTSRVSPGDDLRGISIKDLHLSDVTFKNLWLGYAELDGLHLSQVDLVNVNFIGSLIRQGHILSGKWEDVSFGLCDLSGTMINAVNINNRLAGLGFKYSEVSQWYLVKSLLSSLFTRKGYELEWPALSHTTFLANDVEGLTNPSGRECKEYIDWYQHVFDEMRDVKSFGLWKKFRFSLSLLFTKCWRSYSVLASMSFFVMSIYALVFNSLPACHFKGMEGFLSSLYFSVVTFTTLGYGDIVPVTDVARLISISEVFVGYILLGSFVFLIGHKAAARY